MKNIKNETILLFDLDGTLIDTDVANFLSYQEAIQRIKNLDLKLLYKKNDRFTQKNLYPLIPSLTLEEYEDIIKTKIFLYNKYLNKTKTNPLALEIIKQFYNVHKIILVTNCSKERAIQILRYHKLVDIFNYKFFKEDYKSKEISKFRYALEYLKVSPNQVIIFENDKDEIEKAILSGLLPNNIINLEIQGKKSYE